MCVLRQSFGNRLLALVAPDKSIPQGASTSLYACLEPELTSDALRGSYLSDCKVAQPISAAQSVSLREEFYKVCSEELEEALQKGSISSAANPTAGSSSN